MYPPPKPRDPAGGTQSAGVLTNIGNRGTDLGKGREPKSSTAVPPACVSLSKSLGAIPGNGLRDTTSRVQPEKDTEPSQSPDAGDCSSSSAASQVANLQLLDWNELEKIAKMPLDVVAVIKQKKNLKVVVILHTEGEEAAQLLGQLVDLLQEVGLSPDHLHVLSSPLPVQCFYQFNDKNEWINFIADGSHRFSVATECLVMHMHLQDFVQQEGQLPDLLARRRVPFVIATNTDCFNIVVEYLRRCGRQIHLCDPTSLPAKVKELLFK